MKFCICHLLNYSSFEFIQGWVFSPASKSVCYNDNITAEAASIHSFEPLHTQLQMALMLAKVQFLIKLTKQHHLQRAETEFWGLSPSWLYLVTPSITYHLNWTVKRCSPGRKTNTHLKKNTRLFAWNMSKVSTTEEKRSILMWCQLLFT